MKLIIAAALAATAVVGLAAPVMAQPYGPPPGDHGQMGPMVPGGWDLDRRMDWMQQRINQGRADGSLDRHEAKRVQRELGSIRHEEQRARFAHDGHLTDGDRMQLQDRLDHLNDQIHWLRSNDVRRPW